MSGVPSIASAILPTFGLQFVSEDIRKLVGTIFDHPVIKAILFFAIIHNYIKNIELSMLLSLVFITTMIVRKETDDDYDEDDKKLVKDKQLEKIVTKVVEKVAEKQEIDVSKP
jgi:cadmium resistance protein CadD (predicted permease)